MNRGRLLLSAPSSGGGKTTVTCGILALLRQKNHPTMAFKSGPDYIDPMFHSEILGTTSRNLDLFLMGEWAVLESLRKNTASGEFALIEGAMGFYDGIAMSHESSAYHLARVTKTPTVLVVDGRGMGLSVSAVIQGFLKFREDHQIKGVIFNGISAMLYPRLKESVERELGITVFGYLPRSSDFTLESRHLGLVTAEEVDSLQEKMRILGEQAEKSIDIDGLLELAQTAPDLPDLTSSMMLEKSLVSSPSSSVKIAIAMDKAFCFYYRDALELLTKMGAELIPFSPLKDDKLPEGISGLYLGGGYPELYAKELSARCSLLEEIATEIQNGLPTIAECGGFLYLHKTLEGADGNIYPLCNVISAHGFQTSKLSRFGYVNLTAQENGLLCKKGEVLSAHEFHYWDSEQSGTDFHGVKPQSDRSWDCGYHTKSLYAGFPHCHLGGNPQVAQRFLHTCQEYGKSREGVGTNKEEKRGNISCWY